jgi:hypothetical protein
MLRCKRYKDKKIKNKRRGWAGFRLCSPRPVRVRPSWADSPFRTWASFRLEPFRGQLPGFRLRSVAGPTPGSPRPIRLSRLLLSPGRLPWPACSLQVRLGHALPGVEQWWQTLYTDQVGAYRAPHTPRAVRASPVRCELPLFVIFLFFFFSYFMFLFFLFSFLCFLFSFFFRFFCFLFLTFNFQIRKIEIF